MWLCDKLKVLGIPRGNWIYSAQSAVGRAWVVTFESLEQWIEWIGSFSEELIQWRCEWLGIETSAFEFMNTGMVPIAGLTRFTFYIPFRIQRQLGLIPDLLLMNMDPAPMPPNDQRSFDQYSQVLHLRQYFDAEFCTVHMGGDYKRWLRGDLRRRRISF